MGLFFSQRLLFIHYKNNSKNKVKKNQNCDSTTYELTQKSPKLYHGSRSKCKSEKTFSTHQEKENSV